MRTIPGTKVNFCSQDILDNTAPNFIPKKTSPELNIDTAKLKYNGENPSMAAPIPAPKESRDNASPSINASTPVIVPDLSKSATIGFFKILMTIQSDLISKLIITFSCGMTSFSLSK
jgi:hypothetical protein